MTGLHHRSAILMMWVTFKTEGVKQVLVSFVTMRTGLHAEG